MGSLPRPGFVPPHFHNDAAHIGQPLSNPTSEYPHAGLQQFFERNPQLQSTHTAYTNQNHSCSPFQCQPHHNLHSVNHENPFADNSAWPAHQFAQLLSSEELGRLPAAQSTLPIQENKCSPLKCKPFFVPFHCRTLDGQSNDHGVVGNESTIQGHQQLFSEQLGQFANTGHAYAKQDIIYSPMLSQPVSLPVSNCLQTGKPTTPLARHYLQAFSPNQVSAAQGVFQNPPDVQPWNDPSLADVHTYQVTQGITESAAAAAEAVHQPLSSSFQTSGEGSAGWPEGVGASEVVIVPESWRDGATAPLLVRDNELNRLNSSCFPPCKRKREH